MIELGKYGSMFYVSRGELKVYYLTQTEIQTLITYDVVDFKGFECQVRSIDTNDGTVGLVLVTNKPNHCIPIVC